MDANFGNYDDKYEILEECLTNKESFLNVEYLEDESIEEEHKFDDSHCITSAY